MSVIQRIGARGFRGASQPLEIKFVPEKRIALIFGESGCGKSCIADVIEFALTGRWGSLGEKRGLSTEPARAKFLHSVGSSPSDLLVEVSDGRDVWTARVSRSTPQLSGPDPRPVVAVLRRPKLLTFIEAQPAERYKTLSCLVDVPNCIASEDGLGTALKKVRDDQLEKTAAVARDEAALDGHWKSDGSVGGSWQKWAKDLASQDVAEAEKENNYLEGLLAKVNGLIAAESELQDTQKKLDLAQESLSDARAKLTSVESAGGNSLLADVLTRARDFLRQHPDYLQCPVCEKQNTPSALVSSIEARLCPSRKTA